MMSVMSANGVWFRVHWVGVVFHEVGRDAHALEAASGASRPAL